MADNRFNGDMKRFTEKLSIVALGSESFMRGYYKPKLLFIHGEYVIIQTIIVPELGKGLFFRNRGVIGNSNIK